MDQRNQQLVRPTMLSYSEIEKKVKNKFLRVGQITDGIVPVRKEQSQRSSYQDGSLITARHLRPILFKYSQAHTGQPSLESAPSNNIPVLAHQRITTGESCAKDTSVSTTRLKRGYKPFPTSWEAMRQKAKTLSKN